MSRLLPSKSTARILCAFFVLISVLGTSVAPAASVKAQPLAQQTGTGTVTDTWAVQVAPGADPNQLAQQMGAENLGQIGSLTDYYLFRIPGSDAEATAAADVFAASSQVVWFNQQIARQQSKRVITDPLYPNQWHLADANVPSAWALDTGYTGSGVTIAVVDDGLQYTHPDLSAQYVSAGSWDFNGPDGFVGIYPGDNDPMPDPNNTCTDAATGFIYSCPDNHGTAASGVAAANNDGSSCGVGVAYDAGLAGIRLIAEATTDAQEASALTYAPNTNSIYSNSWGPYDDGVTLQGPGPLTLAALESGITTGRNGKGSIYVWAAGNGKVDNDNVNFDGYANSRYTIAIGAVDDAGIQSYYSEPGAALFIMAPSSGNTTGITTTDLAGNVGYNTAAGTAGNCTSTFGGTSSAAPLVSGVVALMLQANPNLGWRDVQHILAQTANHNISGVSWAINNAGYYLNHQYGFGIVDAAAAVTMAKTWTNVGPAYAISSGVIPVNEPLLNPSDPPVVVYYPVTSTFNVPQNIKLEHVEVVFNSTHDFRGDLRVTLTAPSGIISTLAAPRLNDSGSNFTNWKFMSIRDWGESSAGTWTLAVTDESGGTGNGTFDNWELILYGTPLPSPNMAPTEMNFGNQMYRTSNPPQIATVTNTTAGPLTMGVVSGTNPDFIIGNDLCSNAVIPAGQTCTFNVTYLSPELGTDTGIINLPSDAPNSPFTLYVNGNAIPGSQLLTNRSFESYTADLLPTIWSRTLINPGGLNAVDSIWAFHLTNSMRLVGDGTLKHLYQVINKSGVAGDDFQIFVVSKGSNVPDDADPYRVQIKFFDGTTVMDRRTIVLKPGTYENKRLSIPYTAMANYTRIEYYLTYGKSSGTAWFDLASLQWAP
ncbi:MAG: S8 family serine peptidase [Chloroflexi bacterium]|nr:S8 family serine peptidase [Chloroflexota bacterium]